MKINRRFENMHSFPFFVVFFWLVLPPPPFIFYLLNELSPTPLFFLECLSVLFCITFLWLFLSVLYYFIFPPWSHFPYNLHAATCPALSRTCSQPTIQQTRAGPSHTPVETGKETDYKYDALPAPNTSHHCPVSKPVLFQHLV